MKTIANRCVVAGTGMAGLFAARVASEFFDEVVLIDRDDVPSAPGTRPGLPQGNHFHALLPGGLAIASELFPGLTDDLDEAGAYRMIGGRDFYFYQPEGKSYAIDQFVPEPIENGQVGYVQTRGLLEHTIRRRVEKLVNVTVRYRTKVEAPIVRDGNVCGVTVETAGRAESVDADLVIDATGKVCRTLQWLDRIGASKPDESVVNCDFAYTSVFMRPADWNAFEGTGFFVAANPQGAHPTRGGSLVKMENGIWLASVAGRFGDYPPKDIDGFRAWAKTLLVPVVSSLIERAEPITAPSHFRFPRSIRRHFERLSAFPEGLLPIGDAICHYNPVYGQGMSAAARQTQGLGRLLAARRFAGKGVGGIAKEFFPVAYEETRAPWLMAALADFQVPQTTGDFPAHEQESIEMLMFLGQRAASDPDAREVLMSVGQLRAPLSSLTASPWRELKAAAAG